MSAPRNNAASCSDGIDMFVFGGRVGNNAVGDGYVNTQVCPTM
jgi:hypothetical protein